MSTALDAPPLAAGIAAATWSWKGVRAWADRQCAKALSPRSCLRYLHRLGFVWKRPKRLLVKADPAQRAAFVDQYRTLIEAAVARGARIFFVDEAHFRADGDLRGLWVRRGTEALIPSTSPRLGEKVTYYAGVCLETGDVCVVQVEGTCTAKTSVAFLQALREDYTGELIVIWDNAPGHHGPTLREYLATPDLGLQLIALPAYSPDFNAAEELWKWTREEVTANTCFGTATNVAAALWQFFLGLNDRLGEVTQRCRSELQTTAFPATARHPARRERRLQHRERTIQTALAM